MTRRLVRSLISILGVTLTGCGSLSSSVTQPETYIGISVSTNNLAPLLIERQIASPIETELRQIQQIHRLNVHIVAGSVCIQVWLDSDLNAKPALTEVTAAVKRIAHIFPDAASEPLIHLVKVGTRENVCPK